MTNARALLAMCVLLATGCQIHAADRPGRMVLVVAGNMSIRDIADPNLPHLSLLFAKGSSALLNVRTGRPSKLIEVVETPGMEPGCLSIGAGAMAAGGAEARRACGVRSKVEGSTAGELYTFRTGASPGPAEVVHTETVRIQRANASAAYRARPGALGAALHAAGIQTAVVGNSDLPSRLHREAVTIAMDEAGLVSGGNVDSPRLVRRDPNAPHGIRSSPEALLREIDRALPWKRFVVVDFGDTFRADAFCPLCTERRAEQVRRDAAARLDKFIGLLSTRMRFDRDTLVLLSPSPRTFTEIEFERLTPITIRGPGFEGGLLTSPSTRRRGVITICDVAPTVLAFFGIEPPPEMVGRPARSMPETDASATLVKLNLEASRQGQRQVAMRGSGVAQSVVVVLVTAALLIAGGRRVRRFAAWAALVPAAIPLAMLFLPLVYSGGLAGAVELLVAMTVLVVTASALIFRSPMRALGWLCAAVAGTLVVDLALGARLISSSIAGYSLVEGARYYGIGNELMGTLIGAVVISVGALGDRQARPWASDLLVGAGFAVVFVAIAAPMLGAELGGSGAMAAAAAVTLLARRGWKLNARSVLVVTALGLLGLGGVLAIDAVRGGGAQSHVGRAADLVAQGDLLALLQVAQRKLALNFMLLSTSVWSRLLGLSLLGSALLYWRGTRSDPAVSFSPEERASLAGCLVGAACAFALNDSGVLAAAACSIFAWSLIAIRAAGGREKGRKIGTDPPAH